ncbi:MAG: hypothetical protein RQM92_09360 [Candidatus Syntrophopropionicum ammoniitolerans]
MKLAQLTGGGSREESPAPGLLFLSSGIRSDYFKTRQAVRNINFNLYYLTIKTMKGSAFHDGYHLSLR